MASSKHSPHGPMSSGPLCTRNLRGLQATAGLKGWGSGRPFKTPGGWWTGTTARRRDGGRGKEARWTTLTVASSTQTNKMAERESCKAQAFAEIRDSGHSSRGKERLQLLSTVHRVFSHDSTETEVPKVRMLKIG